MRMAPEYKHFNHTWVDVGKCNGYNYHDLLPFSDLFGETDANRHLYSNEQLYRLFDPALLRQRSAVQKRTLKWRRAMKW